MGYCKYAWIGSQITEETMAKLYQRKLKTKKPITRLVAEAVERYINDYTECPGCNENSKVSEGNNV